MRIFLFLAVVATFFCGGHADAAQEDFDTHAVSCCIAIPLPRPDRSIHSQTVPDQNGGVRSGDDAASVSSQPETTSIGADDVRVEKIISDLVDAVSRLSPSDPFSFIKLTIFPVVAWILKNLISYSFMRVHATRAIYVDVEYRLRFLRLAIREGKAWLENFDPVQPRVPLLNISREDHVVYGAIQADLKECTWGNEVAAIRLFYRSLGEVESIKSRVHDVFQRLLEESRSIANPSTPAAGLHLNLERYRDQVAAEVQAMERIYVAWACIGERAKQRTRRRDASDMPRWVARTLLYRPAFWHLICVLIPCFIFALIGALGLAWGHLANAFIYLLFGLLVLNILLESVLYFFCRTKAERGIKRWVLVPYDRAFSRLPVKNRPPI